MYFFFCRQCWQIYLQLQWCHSYSWPCCMTKYMMKAVSAFTSSFSVVNLCSEMPLYISQQWGVENSFRTYIFKKWISVITVSNNNPLTQRVSRNKFITKKNSVFAKSSTDTCWLMRVNSAHRRHNSKFLLQQLFHCLSLSVKNNSINFNKHSLFLWVKLIF